MNLLHRKLNASGVDPVTTAIQAGSIIAQTVNSINDVNKRRQIESMLNYLSQQQQIDLARQIAVQKNNNDKVNFLVNTLVEAKNAAADRQQKSETVKWIVIAAVGVTTLGILAWYLKKK
jgi:glutaminase